MVSFTNKYLPRPHFTLLIPVVVNHQESLLFLNRDKMLLVVSKAKTQLIKNAGQKKKSIMFNKASSCPCSVSRSRNTWQDSQFQHLSSRCLSSLLLLSLCLKSVNKHMLHQAGAVHNSLVLPMFSGLLLCKVQSSLIPLGEKSQLSRRTLCSRSLNLSSPVQTWRQADETLDSTPRI